MGDTKIAWTETKMIDRGGRRTRVYRKKCPSRPGKQLVRIMKEQGLGWCRVCRLWLPIQNTHIGLCRTHANEAYRKYYANGGKKAIAQRNHARKRRVGPIPLIGQVSLMEWFQGRCAYCGEPATTWDHIDPISKGGHTVPGNILPACSSCNSSKKNRDLQEWADSKGLSLSHLILDVISLLYEAQNG